MNSVNFTGMIICLGIGVVLPIVIVALSLRHKLGSEKNRKDIILAALEKNPNINVEELVKMMNKPDKMIKEKLLSKFQWGILTSIIGVGFVTLSSIMGYQEEDYTDNIQFLGISGAVLLAIGIAFLLTYFYGKKMLSKEMETEEKNMQQGNL
jgi:H+/gluconate symporter-like permease